MQSLLSFSFEQKAAGATLALPHCRLVRFLTEVQSKRNTEAERGFATVATAALSIIADASNNYLTKDDIDSLAWLVVEIHGGDKADLLAIMQSDAPDCSICSALAERLRS